MSRSFGSVPSGQGSTAVDGPDTVAYGLGMAKDKKAAALLSPKAASVGAQVGDSVRLSRELAETKAELNRVRLEWSKDVRKLAKIQDILSNDYDETEA